ncbi:chemotaxis protein CheW [Pleurocapsa sp. PCC 7319]|uniref:chemotaxis protein CheW n=1 Tax=Pleurocapsa sp. PCC 7319 TaxID=118161 RepID=UPI00034DD4F3|nr:chemotaxis protein CheW [Pleurocapsa sp. PCC 7319]
MASKPYVIFSLHDGRYAIAAEAVKEIFFLPELSPVAEAPTDIVGLLNLHSVFVPVMHLDLRFGHKFERCHLTDSVIVIESQGLQVGVIVHQVETVNDIDEQYLQADLSYGREKNISQAFVQGVINLDDEIILLLNVDNLVRHPDELESLVVGEDSPDAKSSASNFYEQYFPAASTNTKEILHQRAINLQGGTDDSESGELIPIAVVSIDGNYYGLDLGIVREFTKIERVTTIPCCPPHIIGNMNLRGEILTLVDIRHPLNLGIDNHRQPAKAVVIEVDDIVVGIAVEEVFDVVDFRPDQLKPVPVATDTNIAAYFKGMADYLDRPLNAIDLPKLLTQGAMTVELAA